MGQQQSFYNGRVTLASNNAGKLRRGSLDAKSTSLGGGMMRGSFAKDRLMPESFTKVVCHYHRRVRSYMLCVAWVHDASLGTRAIACWLGSHDVDTDVFAVLLA
ncbi:hypothetical protein NL676_030126 [Syzygium grande]|nr:hypothetical protein NL676_030126 [Syzygium grande]